MPGDITKVDDANITATVHIVMANIMEALNILTTDEYADKVVETATETAA